MLYMFCLFFCFALSYLTKIILFYQYISPQVGFNQTYNTKIISIIINFKIQARLNIAIKPSPQNKTKQNKKIAIKIKMVFKIILVIFNEIEVKNIDTIIGKIPFANILG